jgi:outer membrane lipoprotein carrier protein
MRKTAVLITGATAALVVFIVFLFSGNDEGENAPASSGMVVVPPPAQVPAAPSAETPVAAARDTALKPPPIPPAVELPQPRKFVPRVTMAASRDQLGPAPLLPNEATLDAAQEGAAALRRASTAYAGIRSLQADFTQTMDNPLLGRRTNSSGTVYQRRPDRFLMKFAQPAGDVIVSDGEFFWIYYPSADARQVIKTKAGAVGGLDLQAQFIGDPTKRFTHTTHGTEQVAGRPALALTLTPREDAGYKTLKVWIDKQDNLVRRFELTNDNGVVQHFDLSNLRINPTMDDGLFRFTPPPNARIIER